VEEEQIFLVDDCDHDAELALRALRLCKILNPVRRFREGESLLKYFSSGESSSPPILLLLDLLLPQKSGLDVLKVLERTGLPNRCPVIMMTGVTDSKAVAECYQAGAASFLVKPISVEDVMNLVGHLPRIRIESKSTGYLVHKA